MVDDLSRQTAKMHVGPPHGRSNVFCSGAPKFVISASYYRYTSSTTSLSLHEEMESLCKLMPLDVML